MPPRALVRSEPLTECAYQKSSCDWEGIHRCPSLQGTQVAPMGATDRPCPKHQASSTADIRRPALETPSRPGFELWLCPWRWHLLRRSIRLLEGSHPHPRGGPSFTRVLRSSAHGCAAWCLAQSRHPTCDSFFSLGLHRPVFSPAKHPSPAQV